jgi:hypothetical protein
MGESIPDSTTAVVTPKIATTTTIRILVAY